mgnify:CR=1 FL=1
MKKDTLYKILFAIELALLPLTIFAYLYLTNWSVGLFVAGVLLCKIWRELFKDKHNRSQVIISSIASVVTNTTLLALFMATDVLNIALGVVTIVAILAKVVCDVLMLEKDLPEFIDAVNYCFVLFECLVLISMIFAYAYSVVLSVSCIASILTGVIFAVYSVYYLIKNMPKKSN